MDTPQSLIHYDGDGRPSRTTHRIVLSCPSCAGRMTVVAFVTDERIVRRILDHLEIPRVTRPTRIARPPPHLDPSADRSDDLFVDPPSTH